MYEPPSTQDVEVDSEVPQAPPSYCTEARDGAVRLEASDVDVNPSDSQSYRTEVLDMPIFR